LWVLEKFEVQKDGVLFVFKFWRGRFF
jgi:hypothetical protein